MDIFHKGQSIFMLIGNQPQFLYSVQSLRRLASREERGAFCQSKGVREIAGFASVTPLDGGVNMDGLNPLL